MSKKQKPHLNLVIIGHVDHGKSTMTGHLLYLTGAVDDRQIAKFAKESESMGRASWKFAWVLDKLKEERERGVTIDIAFFKFSTQKYDFTIIDAPGHRDFVKNMITGTSQADAALLVISAEKGGFEAGISEMGQTREHALLAKTLGVEQLTVCVNKMDTVDYSEDRFNEVKDETARLLTEEKTMAWDLEKIHFIPVSGIEGDNLKEKSANMPWYKGVTLLKAFDDLTVPEKPTTKPLRLPIQDVYSIQGIGTVPSGRVETGIMKPNDKIIFEPAGKKAVVNTIQMHYEEIPQAEPGDNIGFAVKGLSKTEVRRGDVVGTQAAPPTIADTFVATVIVIRHPTVIPVGYTPVIHAGTSQVACTFMEIQDKITVGKGGKRVKVANPTTLKNGDRATVIMKPVKDLVIEPFQEIPQLGRFAVRDMGQTVAVGVVMKVNKKKG
ncbi:MAG: translation elongation factor EF-1 subunit alpha [Candidatus Kariarchaeaceae archaeon]|jgi:elongation factor 1-alpha